MTPEPTNEYKIKRFGYVVSAVLLLASNIALIKNWQITPVIFLITMYFLTGALWGPRLIKPLYIISKKLLFRRSKKKKTDIDKNLFSKN